MYIYIIEPMHFSHKFGKIRLGNITLLLTFNRDRFTTLKKNLI